MGVMDNMPDNLYILPEWVSWLLFGHRGDARNHVTH